MYRIAVFAALAAGSLPASAQVSFSNGGVIASYEETYINFLGTDLLWNLSSFEVFGIFDVGSSFEIQASLLYENRRFQFFDDTDNNGWGGEIYALYRIADHSRAGAFYSRAFQWDANFKEENYGLVYEYQRGPWAVELVATHTPDQVVEFISASVLVEYEWRDFTLSAFHQQMIGDLAGLRRTGGRISYATELITDLEVYLGYSAITGSLNPGVNEFWEIGFEIPFGAGTARPIRGPRY